jgi:hypothetical protein
VKFGGNLANHRLEDPTIGLKHSLLGALLKISVELEEGGVVYGFSVGGKNWTKRRKNSGLPIDQRAVTIEGQDFEAREIEHGLIQFREEM